MRNGRFQQRSVRERIQCERSIRTSDVDFCRESSKEAHKSNRFDIEEVSDFL